MSDAKLAALRSEGRRTEGLRRLEAFVPKAADYGRLRNFDLGPETSPAVSELSPYLRYRLIDEVEVLGAVRAFDDLGVDSFVREVFWRAYFKGWLQMRPEVWRAYKEERDEALRTIETDAGRRRVYRVACDGKTGIACFDAWSDELRATGALHNHARMWFASIWIYTLELPWTLGADFFYRNLLDGDPASNTLSWRWVCGLHTRGKTYLARRDNIRKFTRGRFDPEGLATTAPALDGPPLPAADSSRVPAFKLIDGEGSERALPESYALLVTPEDLLPDGLFGGSLLEGASARYVLSAEPARSPLGTADHVRRFVAAACQSTRVRLDGHVIEASDLNGLLKAKTLVTSFAPVGPVAEALRTAEAQTGAKLLYAARSYDRAAWPHANAGFFKLAKKIPSLLETLSGAGSRAKE